ncbi:hypothetical protein MHOL44478_17840 [Mycobacterium holsaticum DSM 44478]|nr:hypothetical protein [Mycolicibacterium holsaticum DSM 44478 = JCM 12374]
MLLASSLVVVGQLLLVVWLIVGHDSHFVEQVTSGDGPIAPTRLMG